MSVESGTRSARVIVIEDLEFCRDQAIASLEENGHTVVGTASNPTEAWDLFNSLFEMPREQWPDAAAIDNCLDSSNNYEDTTGQEIIWALHRNQFPTIIIGISSGSLHSTNFDLSKRDLDQLGAVVTRLLQAGSTDV